jgi:type I restriction enzyme S subunit
MEHLEPGSLHVRSWGHVADGTTFTRRCRPGQVLFGKRRAYQRKVAVAEFEAVVSGDIYVLAPKNGRLLAELLPFLCLSERFFQHAVGTSAGSLSPRTNWSSLASFEFDLPPLDQQRRIAQLLWAVDECLTYQNNIGLSSDELLRRYLDSLFNYSGNDAQKTQFGRIRSDWRLGKVDEEGDVQLGQQKHPKYDRGSNIRPYLRVDNVRDCWIDATNVLRMHFPEHELGKFELLPGDILLNEGQTREYLGRSAIYRGEIVGCCFQKTLLRFRCGDSLIPEFAQTYFRFLLYSGFFASHASQTAIAHITSVRFKKMPIPVPSLTQQKEIATRIGEIEAVRQSTYDHLDRSRNILNQLTTAWT